MPGLGKISRRDQRRNLNESKSAKETSKKEIIPGLKMLEKMKEKKAAEKNVKLSDKEKASTNNISKRKSTASNLDSKLETIENNDTLETKQTIRRKSSKKAKPLQNEVCNQVEESEKIPGLVLLDIAKENKLATQQTEIKRRKSAVASVNRKSKQVNDPINNESNTDKSETSELSDVPKRKVRPSVARSQSMKMTKVEEKEKVESEIPKRSRKLNVIMKSQSVKSALIEVKEDMNEISDPEVVDSKKRSKKSNPIPKTESVISSKINEDDEPVETVTSSVVPEDTNIKPKKRTRKSVVVKSELDDETSSQTSVNSEVSDGGKKSKTLRKSKSKKLPIISEEKPVVEQMEFENNLDVKELVPITKETKGAGLKRKAPIRNIKDVKKLKTMDEPVEKTVESTKTIDNNIVSTVELVSKANKSNEKPRKAENDKIPGLVLLEEAKMRKSLNNIPKKVESVKPKPQSPERKPENHIIPGLKDIKQTDDDEPKPVVIKDLDPHDHKVARITGFVPSVNKDLIFSTETKVTKIPGFKPVETKIPGLSPRKSNIIASPSKIPTIPKAPTFSSLIESRKDAALENSTFSNLKRDSLFGLSLSTIPRETVPEPMEVSRNDTNINMENTSPQVGTKRSAPSTPLEGLSKHKRIVNQGIFNAQNLTPNPILKRRPSIYTSTPGISDETREIISKRPNVSFHGMVEVKEFLGNSFNSSDEESSYKGNNPFESNNQTNNSNVSGAMKFKKPEPAPDTSNVFRNFLIANKDSIKKFGGPTSQASSSGDENDSESMDVSYSYGQSGMSDKSSDNNDDKSDSSKCRIM